MSESDSELLERMQRGDGVAFGQLYRRHQPRIFRFALMMGGNEGTAADITQEVFLQLMDNTRFDPGLGSLAAYLLGVARNLLRRHYRDHQRFDVLDGEDGLLPEPLVERREPAWHVDRAQQLGALRRAILDLPAYYREVLVLCELEEVDYRDAAAALAIPVGTVRSRLNRARRALATALGAAPAVPTTPPLVSEPYELRTV